MCELKLSRNIRRCISAVALTVLSFHAVASADKPGDGVSVTPIFPSIAEERFRGEIAMEGLRELGYKIKEPKETEYSVMLVALGSGDADFTVHMWDNLHDTFYQKAGGDEDMVKAGDIMPGVLQGYLIDKKTADAYNIKYLTDLKKPEIAKLFDVDGDGKADLTGCNPGWGCELTIDHHLKAYGLEKAVNHNRGSYFALMADTITRYKQGQPILYYTWVPQWIAGVLVEGKDVVWLEVPYTDLPGGNNKVDTSYKGKNLGFAVDKVEAVLNKDFAKENPAALKFLSQMQISTDDESAQNLRMQKGENKPADITRHAKEWVAAHRQQFDAWLQASRAAAQASK
ncbi:glycine betaine/L-proline ABC transporter substrate-binding protein ProX [Pseudomonas hefeiensis]|uniref:Glycine betaine/L-proline ABC transporter substrate-binding protein ProX n=1 Tax=Pseudomonas hefeiensis TaxID=2738125 RepID=A0ABY9G571_9PSED|nr:MULTISPECIES: glycine betaine/L-proline ABC transporter substrate-binding protein ProX [unclassified Pseudomonas]WLH10759.1 glycine betaine/L-proline ABC transporter substrate-binding protein ProX [Pseudomonas sp. FP205]WLH93840.1 glycine betaine/L-proline ABC transporter substrate-binding protein ProX [Pseudomonas sp. FP53]WLI38116.1 glycine betaine/L-proline ABC transporter substrate-binding protein ProX [Pseudomonas sp. FP821]